MQNQKKQAKGNEAYNVSPLQNRLNLKPNEAYEPGFGKYTLTESELRAGEINQQEIKKFTENKSVRFTSEELTTNSRQPQERQITKALETRPGISHSKGEPESEIVHNRKIRDDNTNMHNNW